MYPALYHAHHAQEQEDLPFWVSLARQQTGPILELGCGTGRVLQALAQAGLIPVGLDLDWEILAFLRQSAPDGQQVPVFQADMARFHLARQYGLILLPCNTLSTLAEFTRAGLFRCVRQHLLPDGWFVASLPNPVYLRRLPRHSAAEVETVFTHPDSGNPVQVSSAWQRTKDVLELAWHYDHLLPDGTVQRHTTRVSHTLQPLEAYQRELAAAGLAAQALWGNYDFSAYSPDSPYLILKMGLQE
jgi:SAM-dependent methyltransferase